MTGGEGTFMVPTYPDPHQQNVNSLPMDFSYGQDNPLFDRTPPSVPTGLSSPSKTTTSISVSWTASTDGNKVDHYNVYVGNAVTNTVKGTSATVSGLTTGTLYNIKVTAVDQNGNESAKTANLAVTTS